MLSSCLNYRKKTGSKIPRVVKTQKGKPMLLSVWFTILKTQNLSKSKSKRPANYD